MKLVRSYSSTCWCPDTAASGAHGLVASAVTAFPRFDCTSGSVERFSGIAGGPSGLSVLTAVGESAIDAFFFTLTTLSLFSKAPVSIHFEIVASMSSGSFGSFGGITGCSLCDTRAYSRLLSTSPGSTTAPDAPPCIVAPYVSSTSPPFASPWLWQLPHFAFKIGATWSWKVTFSAGLSSPRAGPDPSTRPTAQTLNSDRRFMTDTFKSRRTVPPRPAYSRVTLQITRLGHTTDLTHPLLDSTASVSHAASSPRRGLTDQWLNKNSRLLSSDQNRSSSTGFGSVPAGNSGVSAATSSAVGFRPSVLM